MQKQKSAQTCAFKKQQYFVKTNLKHEFFIADLLSRERFSLSAQTSKSSNTTRVFGRKCFNQ